MAAETAFPPFNFRVDHEPNPAAESRFLAEVDGTFNRAEQRFAEFSQEARRQLDTALSTGRRSGSLDIDAGGAQEAARAAQTRAVAARELLAATEAAARAEGDYSAAARQTIAALQGQAREEEEAARAAQSHAAAILQVQRELDKTASETSQITGEFLRLAQAEAGAADGARLLEGIYRGTSAELGRVANSARESAQAFELMFQAQEARSSVAAQGFFNSALGIDAQAKSARDSARAFEEMFAAQQLAEAAQKEMAAGAAQLRGQLDPTFAAQQRFDQELARADKLLEAGAISTREYAQAQQLARDNLRGAAQAATQSNEAIARSARVGTTAQRNVINSTRASRTAFIQLGQQMQDVTIQAQMGTNAMMIFAQQVPQAAFALSGLESSANKTQARIGRFATFLSGPWGAAIFAGTAILGPLAYAMLGAGDAAEEAEKKTYDFAEGLDVLELSAVEAKNAMDQLADATRGAIAVQGNFLRTQSLVAEQSVTDLESRIESASAELRRLNDEADDPLALLFPAAGPDVGRRAELRRQIEADRDALRTAQQAATDARIATSQQNVIERLDPAQAAKSDFERQIGELNREFRRSQDDPIGALNDGILISQAEYEAEFERLSKLRDAAIEASRETRTRRQRTRTGKTEAERLAEFAEKTEERILRINERFDEQPRLIDQAARATRELDAIIAELSERKPANFEQMIDDARDAQDVIQEALVRPFQELEEASERRLQIERLLLAGRQDEAEALQIIWSLERELGPLTEARKADILDMVAYEREITDELDRRYEQQQAYLDATRSLRSELESLFSGDGFDLESIGRQLQAKLTVERIFGDALRDLEDEIKDSYDTNVDYLERETTRAGDAARDFADAIDTATRAVAASEAQMAQTSTSLIERTEFLARPTIDPSKRPPVANPDGSFSTIETTSFGSELGEVLIPTIVNGVRVSFDEALRHFEETGEHLGIFSTPQEADAFARALSEAQGNLQAVEEAAAAAARETDRAALEVGELASAASQAAQAATDYAQFQREFDATIGAAAANDNDTIVVTAEPGRDSIAGMSPEEYFDLVGKRMVEPLLVGLEDVIGVQLANEIKGVLGGALGGYIAAGPVGGVLGGLKELPGLSEGIQGALEDAFGGAVQGQQYAAILQSLGVGNSGLGSTIGGAIGAVFGGPIGAAVGSLAGGLLEEIPLLGGLLGEIFFGGSDRGSAIISGGKVSGYYGDTQEYKDAAGGLAGNVLDALENVADALGADYNASAGQVSIGIRDGVYSIDPQGRGYTKSSKYPDIQTFGNDPEAAVRAAILDLINDGVIAGLSAAEQRLLKQGDDIEKALQDVLDFRGVFDELRRIKDPLGYEIEQLDKEFERLIDVFNRAGASSEEFAKLEELYGLKRAELIEQATERVAGSLKDLLDDLLIGDSGLSLRDRRANALGQYDDLAARVQSGDVTAFDDFAEIARELLAIERELFGSQEEYFDRFGEVRDITQGALTEQERRIAEAANRDNPFGSSGSPGDAPLIAAIDGGNQQIIDRLDALNRNIGQLIVNTSGGTAGISDLELWRMQRAAGF